MIAKTKLVIFDVDGVLLDTEMGATKEILIGLGLEDQVKELDREYQERKKAGPWGLPELVALYKDFELSVLNFSAENFCAEKLMPGAVEAVQELHRRGIKVGAISSNLLFILNVLKKKLDLDFVCGLEMEFLSRVATGHVDKVVDRNEKAKILVAKIIELRIKKEEVVVVGDSITDLLMADEAGKFIAFNAKPEAAAKANVVIKKKDLREIINYI